MANAGTIGTLGQLAIATASGVAAAVGGTLRYDYKECNLRAEEEMTDLNGVRGTLSPHISRVRITRRRCMGTIVLQPNLAEMKALMPWILGGTPAGTDYPLSDFADPGGIRYITRDEGLDGQLKYYDYCAVDKAVFECRSGEALKLTLEVVARDETLSAATMASLPIDIATTPWIFSDCAISVNGTTAQAEMVRFTIDNKLDKDRFFNSLVWTVAHRLDREMTFETSIPKLPYLSLYGAGGEAGVLVSMTYTNGAGVLTQTLTKAALPKLGPQESGRKEIMLPFKAKAYASGATTALVRELITTLV